MLDLASWYIGGIGDVCVNEMGVGVDHAMFAEMCVQLKSVCCSGADSNIFMCLADESNVLKNSKARNGVISRDAFRIRLQEAV